MAKKNYSYSDFNKPKKNEKYRPILMLIIAIFGIGYLIVYQIFLANNANGVPNTPNEPDTIIEGSQQNTGSTDTQAGIDTMSNNPLPNNPMIEDSVTVDTSDDTLASTGTTNDTSVNNDTSAFDTNQAASDISTDNEAYTEETPNKSKDLVMYSEDRTTYQDGFFYQPITDDVKARIYGLSYKKDCTIPYEDLRYVSVLYYDFDANVQIGEIVCNKSIAKDLVEIFYELYCNEYQIDKIRLVDEYNADDDLSCADNNTSCFNFRTVEGSNNLSKHAQGVAIDINPFQNPYVTYPNGKERISPPGSEPYADRKSGLDHMITEDDLCYKLFTQHGFSWGGHWKSLKDYQHFQKPL